MEAIKLKITALKLTQNTLLVATIPKESTDVQYGETAEKLQNALKGIDVDNVVCIVLKGDMKLEELPDDILKASGLERTGARGKVGDGK